MGRCAGVVAQTSVQSDDSISTQSDVMNNDFTNCVISKTTLGYIIPLNIIQQIGYTQITQIFGKYNSSD